METPAGKEAIGAFMNAWAQSLVPKSLTISPAEVTSTGTNPFDKV